MLNYLWTNNMSDNRLLKYNFAKNNDDADPCQAHLAPIISKKCAFKAIKICKCLFFLKMYHKSFSLTPEDKVL